MQHIDNNKLVAVCQEESAKRCALLFENVTVISQWNRGFEFHDELEKLKPNFLTICAIQDKNDPKIINDFSDEFMWQIAISLSGRGYESVPIYNTTKLFKSETESEFAPQDHKIQRLILDNMPIIDDSNLSWEQIVDIRLNNEVLQKFVALRMWLRSLGVNVSAQEFQDHLDLRMMQYQTALRTNGLKTLNGALSLFVEPSKLATAASIVSGTAFTLGAASAAMMAGFLTAGNVAVKLTEYMIGKNQIRSDFGEIAILEEIKQLTTRK